MNPARKDGVDMTTEQFLEAFVSGWWEVGYTRECSISYHVPSRVKTKFMLMRNILHLLIEV